MNSIHIVITRTTGTTGLNVYLYRSLGEAARKAYGCARKNSKEKLELFCIEHPYNDVLSFSELGKPDDGTTTTFA